MLRAFRLRQRRGNLRHHCADRPEGAEPDLGSGGRYNAALRRHPCGAVWRNRARGRPLEGVGQRGIDDRDTRQVVVVAKGSGDMVALTDAMQADFGFASVAELLSGRGISYLHRVLHGHAADPATIMSDLSQGLPEARATAAAFVRIMGTVVGDLALAHLPFGGIYLAGGVTRAIAPYLAEFGFAEHLRAKGRFASFMAHFGVSVVRDDYVALTGCTSHLALLHKSADGRGFPFRGQTHPTASVTEMPSAV
jgi:hypothetical protein